MNYLPDFDLYIGINNVCILTRIYIYIYIYIYIMKRISTLPRANLPRFHNISSISFIEHFIMLLVKVILSVFFL